MGARKELITGLSKMGQYFVLFLGLYISLSFIRDPLYSWISGLGLSDIEIFIVGIILMVVCGYWAGEIE